jgi:hypothetical protein
VGWVAVGLPAVAECEVTLLECTIGSPYTDHLASSWGLAALEVVAAEVRLERVGWEGAGALAQEGAEEGPAPSTIRPRVRACQLAPKT